MTVIGGRSLEAGSFSGFWVWCGTCVKALMFLALAFEVWNIAVYKAYLDTLQAIGVTAVADNAAVKQRGEAVATAAKGRSELEVARNAAERVRAEADRTVAEAVKVAAEAVTAEEAARNAEKRYWAEAEALKFEAATKAQTALVEIEKARVAARREAAVADQAVLDARNAYEALGIVIASYNLGSCPGRDHIAKVNAKAAHRC